MYYGIYKTVRNAAWQCLVDNNIRSLPVDVIKIAKNFGIRIVRNSLVNELGSGERGKSFLYENDCIVVYDDTMPINECRFTVAHELGHIFLGHSFVYNRYNKTTEFDKKSKSEQQADMFAARLLSPLCILNALDVKDKHELQRLCKMPIDVAASRNERLKVVQKRNKFLTANLEARLYEQFKEFIEATAQKCNE